jgi:cysteine-rich repeat protein
VCGDGFVYEGMEECDDGNNVDNDLCQNDCISNGVFYKGSFTQNQTNSQQACNDWNTFRNQIKNLNFGKVRIYGSQDMVGVECNGGAADQLCDALANAQTLQVMCDGRTWRVGECGVQPGSWEISANGSTCQCTNPGHIARPCIGNANWGGVNTATCGGATQTIEVVCQ